MFNLQLIIGKKMGKEHKAVSIHNIFKKDLSPTLQIIQDVCNNKETQSVNENTDVYELNEVNNVERNMDSLYKLSYPLSARDRSTLKSCVSNEVIDTVLFLDSVSRTNSFFMKPDQRISLQPEIIASVVSGMSIVNDSQALQDAFKQGLAKALKLEPNNHVIVKLVEEKDFVTNAVSAYNHAVLARTEIRKSSSIAAFGDWCAEQLHKIIPGIKDVLTNSLEKNDTMKSHLDKLNKETGAAKGQSVPSK